MLERRLLWITKTRYIGEKNIKHEFVSSDLIPVSPCGEIWLENWNLGDTMTLPISAADMTQIYLFGSLNPVPDLTDESVVRPAGTE